MDVAIVGAFGTVGRQCAMQLVTEQLLPPTSRLQLVGHKGGNSANEMLGFRADLWDAFVDECPQLEVTDDLADVDADVVIVLAGATVPLDLSVPADREAIGAHNRALFNDLGGVLGASDRRPIVLVASNPVELGVHLLAESVGRHRVIGIGSPNDSARFRRELAAELGVRRAAVSAVMLGQHGSHLVPVWSHVAARGVKRADLAAAIERMRAGRVLADFATEVDTAKAEMLALVASHDVDAAFAYVQQLTPDLRSAVKPFFIHFTSGRTTEMSTAHATLEVLAALVRGERHVIGAQVALDGEWNDWHGVLGVQVILAAGGWSDVIDMRLAPDETDALVQAGEAIAAANAALLGA